MLGLSLGAAKPSEAALFSPKVVMAHLRAAGRSTFVEGPHHSFKAITKRPLRYSAMLLGIAGAGAGAEYVGVNPAPFWIGLSVAATGWSAWQALPLIRSLRGVERTRVIGREIFWPVALSAGTTVIGHYGMGQDGAHYAVNAKMMAKTGLQSAVIAFDVPTIVQTVLDDRSATGSHGEARH